MLLANPVSTMNGWTVVKHILLFGILLQFNNLVLLWFNGGMNAYRNSSRNPVINPLTANLLVVYGTTFISPTKPAIEETATM